MSPRNGAVRVAIDSLLQVSRVMPRLPESGVIYWIFSLPTSKLIEKARSEIYQARRYVDELTRGLPGIEERIKPASGALTCALALLYNIAREYERHESYTTERSPEDTP